MKSTILKTVLLIILVSPLVINGSFAQKMKWGLGGEVIYNFPPKSLGFGIRGMIPIIETKLHAVPQIAYHPSILSSTIKDFHAGAAIHYAPITFAMWSPYVLGAGGFNKRTVLETKETPEEKFSTWSGELGLGVRMETCWRPFAEFRYNFKWKEPTVRVGLMYVFNCKEEQLCPAYRESW